MKKLILKEDDSYIKVRINKDDPKNKFIEVEFNDIIGEDVANTITSLAGIIGEQTGARPEEALLDIITRIAIAPMVQKQS